MNSAPDFYDVLIVGGGASGLAAAISAARAGARTCILERDVASGLSILATGNGRCNISNARLCTNRYLHADAARSLLGRDAAKRLDEFFQSVGIMTVESGEGRLYPVTRRADSVRDALLGACERLGVEMRCGAVVSGAEFDSQERTWRIAITEPERPVYARSSEKAELRRARKLLEGSSMGERGLRAAAVVIAVGGRSQETCAAFGLPHIDETPLLCPIACRIDAAHGLVALDGLRVEAMLVLKRDGAAIGFEQGEVLFRPYGISGIAAFNLSRRCRPKDTIELDLFPDINDEALEHLLRAREEQLGPLASDPAWFDGMLARPVATVLLSKMKAASNVIGRAAALLHRLPLEVEGLAEERQAQVRRGGIPLDAVDLTELRIDSKGDRSLYACGEALDMDADCGGYNLAWAWMTGIRAGSCAAKRAIALP